MALLIGEAMFRVRRRLGDVEAHAYAVPEGLLVEELNTQYRLILAEVTTGDHVNTSPLALVANTDDYDLTSMQGSTILLGSDHAGVAYIREVYLAVDTGEIPLAKVPYSLMQSYRQGSAPPTPGQPQCYSFRELLNGHYEFGVFPPPDRAANVRFEWGPVPNDVEPGGESTGEDTFYLQAQGIVALVGMTAGALLGAMTEAEAARIGRSKDAATGWYEQGYALAKEEGARMRGAHLTDQVITVRR